MATLVHCWDFHEGTGNDVADIVGTNEGTRRYSTSGTLGEGPTWITVDDLPGKSYALSFDGVDDFVGTSTQYLLAEAMTYSFAARFRTTVASGNKIFGFETAQYINSDSVHDDNLYVNTDGKLVFGRVDAANGLTWAETVISSETVTDGEWHEAVVTTDGGTSKLYLDASLVGTLAITSRTEFYGYWRIGGSDMSGFHFFGAIWPKSDAQTWAGFDGDISDIKYYSDVLTEDEIPEVFNPPSQPANALMFSCNT